MEAEPRVHKYKLWRYLAKRPQYQKGKAGKEEGGEEWEWEEGDKMRRVEATQMEERTKAHVGKGRERHREQ